MRGAVVPLQMDEQHGRGPVEAEQEPGCRGWLYRLRHPDGANVLGEGEDEGDLEQLGRLEGHAPWAEAVQALSSAPAGCAADDKGQRHQDVSATPAHEIFHIRAIKF